MKREPLHSSHTAANALPWQVRHEISQAEHLMVHTPWEKAVQVAGQLFLRR